MKSKLLSQVRVLLDLALLALLGYCTVIVLVRRWVWQQVPSQIGMGLVYAILLVNGWLIWRMARSLRARLAPSETPAASTKTEKS